MHSEMMAIRSACSLSSGTQSSQTSARSGKCFEKPCFSLSADPKKWKARARGLKSYAEAVLSEATAGRNSTAGCQGGKFSIQESRFEPGSSQPGGQGERQVQRQGAEQQVLRVGAGEHGEKCEETPTEEERERVSVRVSVWEESV